MGKLFGTSGVRGIFNEDLTPERVLNISMAIGSYYGPKSKALVGWDCRLSSKAISSIVIGGLISVGIDVYDCGYITTPAFQKYLKESGKFNFGLIVTASHNPPQYNGIKLIGSDGLEEYVNVEDKIEKILEERQFTKLEWNEVGVYKQIGNTPVIDTYVKSLINYLDKLSSTRKYKVVFDFVNCVSVFTIKKLVEKSGIIDPIYVNENLDGRFPNRPSEPKPENLTTLKETVVKTGADFGVGFDGDGDRAIIVDENGDAWWGDYLGTAIGKYLKETKGLTGLATPVTSSSVVDIVLGKLDVPIYRTKVGAKHIVRKMIEKNLVLGFEENGGIIYSPHVLTRDGGIATILTINMLNHFGQSLSQIMKSLPTLYQKKDKIRLINRNKLYPVLSKLREEFEDKCIKIDAIDGIKLFFSEDEWVLVRPSGTEPIIRVFAESRDPAKTEDMVSFFKKKLLNYLESV